jgi:cation diffusion facilitator CzcD-associated flavoprotein CzcO
VRDAVWDERTHTYTVNLEDGEPVVAHMVVSALGLLNYPKYPDWPGLEDFAGPKFHTFRWEHEHDLTGKRVAVVGTGSTASQIIPEIAPIVDHVYLFQREPGWVVPKGDRDFTPEERTRYQRKLQRRITRWKRIYQLEKYLRGGAVVKPGTKINGLREQQCRS